jgi:GNAT superfamily N-acetyltransferase
MTNLQSIQVDPLPASITAVMPNIVTKQAAFPDNEFTFVKYNPRDPASLSLTAQLVECYREVFAPRPWREWLKCSNSACNKYWGTDDKDQLAALNYRHCDKPVKDFWPREQVIIDIYNEITPEASCWLALCGDKVAGFCWGYPIDKTKLEKKLGVTIDYGLLGNDFQIVAYQDEVGVAPEYRNRKLAKALVALRFADFAKQGLQVGIVRTREAPQPSETFLWYTKKLGYKVLARYPGDDGRVILGRRISDLKLEL